MHAARDSSSHEKIAPFLGTAIGAGNFLVLPSLLIDHDFRLVLFFHLISLFILGAPLMASEIIWGRWLRRAPQESFSFLKFPYRLTHFVSFAALIFVTPIYFQEIQHLFLWMMDLWGFNRIQNPGLQTLALTENIIASFVSGLFLIVLMIPVVRMPRPSIRSFFMRMLFVGLIFIVLSFASLPSHIWSLNKELVFQSSKSLSVNYNLLLKVTSFSLFTLSAGFGLHYWFTTWISPLRRTHKDLADFWKKSGRVHKIVLQIIFYDFLVSLIAAFFIVPALDFMQTSSPELSLSNLLYVDWPKYFIAVSGSHTSIQFLSVVLFILGFLSLTSLVLLGIYSTRTLLNLRSIIGSAALFLSYIGLSSLLVNIPHIKSVFTILSMDILLPTAALLWSLSVGFHLKPTDLYIILGRSPISDALTLLWHFALKYLVPTVLILYFSFRFFAWAS